MSQSFTSPSSSAHRRRTDLMPTITLGNRSRAPRSVTPSSSRTSGKAISMTRLDQLSKPRQPKHVGSPNKLAPTTLRQPQVARKSISMLHLNQRVETGPSPPKLTPRGRKGAQQQTSKANKDGKTESQEKRPKTLTIRKRPESGKPDGVAKDITKLVVASFLRWWCECLESLLQVLGKTTMINMSNVSLCSLIS